MIRCLQNSISEFRLAVTMPKQTFELWQEPKPGRNQNASYGRNRNQKNWQFRCSLVFPPNYTIACLLILGRNRNRNRKLQTSKAPLKSQAQGTSLFTSAASNQRGFPKNSPWEAQVRF